MDRKARWESLSKEAQEEGYRKAIKQQNRLNYLGFAIFDGIHIVVALVLFIHVCVREHEQALELAECIVEFVLSLALFGFVHALAEKRHSDSPAGGYLSCAWLFASCSLIIPTLFDFAPVIYGEKGTMTPLVITLTSTETLMFISFFLAMFLGSKTNANKILNLIGMSLFGISGISGIVYFSIYLDAEKHWAILALELIKEIAPVILASLGIYGLIKTDLSENGRFL